VRHGARDDDRGRCDRLPLTFSAPVPPQAGTRAPYVAGGQAERLGEGARSVQQDPHRLRTARRLCDCGALIPSAFQSDRHTRPPHAQRANIGVAVSAAWRSARGGVKVGTEVRSSSGVPRLSRLMKHLDLVGPVPETGTTDRRKAVLFTHVLHLPHATL
jgi:hypothetical protein